MILLTPFATLQAALDAVKSELMLFGVASLLLNVFESPITNICSKNSFAAFHSCLLPTLCLCTAANL